MTKSAMAKRLFDTFFAAVGLLVLAPLFALIALWIKWDSAGPVFFRQERIGRHGQPFRIHKFRTMVHGGGQTGALITVGNDSRITRVGHWLRNSKLDELPQLIDVLVGRMSLVGPRPEVAKYVEMYPAEIRQKVLSVRPGITDLASIRFRDEAAQLSNASDPERKYAEFVLPEKLKLSAEYIDQASLLTDMKIILQTLSALLGRRR
jgi:lipopolysaccharide/colanic/teichoic acid biosynthesis glycosyltransferase